MKKYIILFYFIYFITSILSFNHIPITYNNLIHFNHCNNIKKIYFNNNDKIITLKLYNDTNIYTLALRNKINIINVINSIK